MSYNTWTTITPTVPSGYTFQALVGIDASNVLYGSFSGLPIPSSPGYNYGCLGRSVDGGQTWTDMFYNDVLQNTTPQYVVATSGNMVWVEFVSTSYTPTYLYYSTNHGLTWNTCTNGGSRSWEKIVAGTDGYVYGISNTYGGGIIKIGENQICTTIGYTNNSYSYSNVFIDQQNNLYGVFSNGNIYVLPYSGGGTLYTNLVNLNGISVNGIFNVAGQWLAYDIANQRTLVSPDANFSSVTVSSSLGSTYLARLVYGPGGLYATYSGMLYFISGNPLTLTSTPVNSNSYIDYMDTNNNAYGTIPYGPGVPNPLISKGTYTPTKTLYAYTNGAWKNVQAAYASDGVNWKQVTSINGMLNGNWS